MKCIALAWLTTASGCGSVHKWSAEKETSSWLPGILKRFYSLGFIGFLQKTFRSYFSIMKSRIFFIRLKTKYSYIVDVFRDRKQKETLENIKSPWQRINAHDSVHCEWSIWWWRIHPALLICRFIPIYEHPQTRKAACSQRWHMVAKYEQKDTNWIVRAFRWSLRRRAGISCWQHHSSDTSKNPRSANRTAV